MSRIPEIQYNSRCAYSLVLLRVVEIPAEAENLRLRAVDHVVFPPATLLDSESSPLVLCHQPLRHTFHLQLGYL